MTEKSSDVLTHDSDTQKGSVESDRPEAPANQSSTESMSGQLGHRDEDAMLKDNDSDFPEPDAEAEHSGQ
jgi:hypothetical protein